MHARTNQLRPTVYVDAVPELAATRKPREGTGATRSADEQAQWDREEDQPAWDQEAAGPLEAAEPLGAAV
jgi:hypothetical protein